MQWKRLWWREENAKNNPKILLVMVRGAAASYKPLVISSNPNSISGNFRVAVESAFKL